MERAEYEGKLAGIKAGIGELLSFVQEQKKGEVERINTAFTTKINANEAIKRAGQIDTARFFFNQAQEILQLGAEHFSVFWEERDPEPVLCGKKKQIGTKERCNKIIGHTGRCRYV